MTSPASAPARRSGRHHLVHFLYDFAQVEGLGEDFRACRRRRAGRQRHGGETGDENDLHGGVEFGTAAGEFDPVEARHHDVGEQQVEHFAFQRLQGAFAIGIVLHVMPGTAQRRRQEAAHRIIVFREQDLGHAVLMPGESGLITT